MRAGVSVVIPTLNAARRLPPLLEALTEGVVAGLVRDVVMADGGSSDATAAIAEATGARFVSAPRGRGRQLAAGVAAARAEWLLVLHADSVPQSGWIEAAARHIHERPGRAGWFRLAFDDLSLSARRTAAWANLRAAAGLPYGDQGLLIARALYAEAGGFPPVPIMEDVALARALGRARLAPLDARIVTSAERYRREGWTRRGWRNLTTLTLYAAGVAPERLVRRYER